jgi:creatinine amidohydrolase
MRLEDMNWMDVERYLQHDHRIILITGATEQHCTLSLLTDILTPCRLAAAATERENVLVAPPLNFGNSQQFMTYPGTISISPEIFHTVLTEIVQGLLAQGFTSFFILNGHGGNNIPSQLEDLQLDGHAGIVWYDWWHSSAVHAFEAEHQMRLEHANWGENFPFNRVGPVPEGEKPLVNLGYLEAGHSVRDVLGDGSYGGPYQVDDALMDDLFQRVVDEIVELVRGMRR